jgi:adenosylhomocysteine nucleosidase
MAVETQLIRDAMTSPRDTTLLGLRFTTGLLGAERVVVADAGIGKVNAAVTTTLLIEHFSPSLVIFTGIAGGLNPELDPGDIVIASEVAHHDFAIVTDDSIETMATRNPASGEVNPIKIPADSAMLAIAREAAEAAAFEPVPLLDGSRPPRVFDGIVVTGESFIASGTTKQELRRRFRADAVEMEGAAVAQVCYQMGVPWLVIRSISDRADSSAVRDADRFYQIAAHNSASLVITLMDRLPR